MTHKDFEEIALFFLNNGFKLTIFTNGYNYIRLKNFLEITKEYHMFVRISLDGLKETHNAIQFPDCLHQYDLIFPVENEQQKKSSFSLNELDALYNKCPFIFRVPKSDVKRKYRCTGGVTSAAIDSSKHLKLCPAAQGDQFCIGDLNQSNLYDLWVHPNSNGEKFRKEKSNKVKGCKRCSKRKQCNIVNCRLLAYHYTKDMNNPNPITCFMEEKRYNG